MASGESNAPSGMRRSEKTARSDRPKITLFGSELGEAHCKVVAPNKNTAIPPHKIVRSSAVGRKLRDILRVRSHECNKGSLLLAHFIRLVRAKLILS